DPGLTRRKGQVAGDGRLLLGEDVEVFERCGGVHLQCGGVHRIGAWQQRQPDGDGIGRRLGQVDGEHAGLAFHRVLAEHDQEGQGGGRGRFDRGGGGGRRSWGLGGGQGALIGERTRQGLADVGPSATSRGQGLRQDAFADTVDAQALPQRGAVPPGQTGGRRLFFGRVATLRVAWALERKSFVWN
ncbi:hypothetical protein B7Z17_02030, partial [Candidatus Saccharibacteria bacterium 32-49-10]